jgi:hypothetical protein
VSVPTAELTAPGAATPTAATLPALARRLTGGRLFVALVGFSLAVGALSLLLPSTPSYDPWAWLVWGREIVHLKLQTTGGPTWKPLPVIFTTLFAPFGKAAPDLWLAVARAGGVMAVAMVFKLAARFTYWLTRTNEDEAAPKIRTLVPALLAGLIGAATIVVSRGFITDNALGYSEGLMTALVLVGVDRHLAGAPRQAFAVGFFAALDRPELWLLWGPYGLYLWRKDPGARKLVIALFALIPVLWFLPEYWGSGHFFRGVSRAQHPRSNSPAFAKCPFCTEFRSHALAAVLLRTKAVAGLTMVVAAFGLWRMRDSWLAGGFRSWLRHGFRSEQQRARAAVIVAGAAGLGWWVLIAVLTQAGFSGNDRYLVLGAALVTIAGGVGWGWAAYTIAGALRRLSAATPMRLFASASAATLTAAIAAGAFFLAIPPRITKKIPYTHRALVYQARLRTDMTKAVQELGGPSRILRCGTVMTEGFQVPMLAWTLGVHSRRIEASPLSQTIPPSPPNVIFQTRAQRNAHLLPLLSTWPGTRYTLVARLHTFMVYADCTGNVTL